MRQLVLTQQHLDLIYHHAAQHPTHEVCGFIGGFWKLYNQWAMAEQVIGIPNIAASPHIQFRMDAQAQVKALFELFTAKLDLIGIYHSHPLGPSTPSETDIRECTYPDAIYVITFPIGNNKYDARAWWLRNKKPENVQIKIGE